MSRRAVVALLMLTLTSLAVLALTFNPRWISLFPAPTKPAVNASNAGNASSVNASVSSPPRVNVTVRLVAVPGGAGVAFVNGSRLVAPATLSVARCSVLNVTQDSWPGWEALNGTLLVRACRDTTLRLAWRRIYATVRFEGEGPFQLDGKNMSAPVAVKLPLYTVHNVTQLPYRRGAAAYTPLNHTLAINVTGNLTVRLAWRMRCMGVYIASDAGPVKVLVNGSQRTTPVCVEAPATLETGIEGPAINSTHRWWLAWYWVEENGSRRWWSPGINGSKLRIDRPANVTLHYLPGLKELPYVLRVYRWPEPYFNGSCPLNPGRPAEEFRVEKGWLHAYNPKPCVWKGKSTSMWGVFAVDPSVRLVAVEVEVPTWKKTGYGVVNVFIGRGGEEAGGVGLNVICGRITSGGFEPLRGDHSHLYIVYDGLPDPGTVPGYNGPLSYHLVQPGDCENNVISYGWNMYGYVKAKDFWNYLFTLPKTKAKIIVVEVYDDAAGESVYIRLAGVAP